jgi:hypothetical protein
MGRVFTVGDDLRERGLGLDELVPGHRSPRSCWPPLNYDQVWYW